MSTVRGALQRLNYRIAVWDNLASPQLGDFCWFFGDVLWRMPMPWEDNSKAPAILKVEMNHWFVRVPSKRSRMRDRWPPIEILCPLHGHISEQELPEGGLLRQALLSQQSSQRRYASWTR